MNTNLQNLTWQRQEKESFKNYREKVIELGRDLLESKEITQDQFNNSYFELYLK